VVVLFDKILRLGQYPFWRRQHHLDRVTAQPPGRVFMQSTRDRRSSRGVKDGGGYLYGVQGFTSRGNETISPARSSPAAYLVQISIGCAAAKPGHMQGQQTVNDSRGADMDRPILALPSVAVPALIGSKLPGSSRERRLTCSSPHLTCQLTV
jgi:hypothetical protein